MSARPMARTGIIKISFKNRERIYHTTYSEGKSVRGYKRCFSNDGILISSAHLRRFVACIEYENQKVVAGKTIAEQICKELLMGNIRIYGRGPGLVTIVMCNREANDISGTYFITSTQMALNDLDDVEFLQEETNSDEYESKSED